MATSNVVANRGKQQYQGIYSDMWLVSGTDATVAPTTGIDVISTVTVPGVALGDAVGPIGLSVDAANMTVTGYVSAADTVKIVYANNTASTITLTTPNFKFTVVRFGFGP